MDIINVFRNVLRVLLITQLIFMAGPVLAGINDGLVAFYPFSGNAQEATGAGPDGAVNGATLTDDHFGSPDSAYNFDGVNDSINLGNTLNFPAWDTYSVSLWFLNDGGGNTTSGYGQKILSKGQYYSDFHLHVAPTEGRLYWWSDQGGFVSIGDTSKNYRDDTWHHVVINMFYVNANERWGEMWVDGVLKVSGTLWKVTNAVDLLIGYTAHSDSNQQRYWSGKIDDIRVYDRTLAETEILELFTGLPLLPGTVTSLADSGPGSLRQVIADADPGDTIDFAVTGTITLTSGELVIDKNLVIASPGADILTVSGNHTSLVFNILSGTDVAITGVSIVDGGGVGYGGGIYNSGTLTLKNSNVSGNSVSQNGGGIMNCPGSLTVENSTVSGNSAVSGAGIYTCAGSLLTLSNSTVSGNSGMMGGITNVFGTVVLSNSTVSGNTGSYTGGIQNILSGTVILRNSVVASQDLGKNCRDDELNPGQFISQGYNLDSDGTCNLTEPTDLPNTDPLLGPLADNGGPTFTHALLTGSPAFDHIPLGANGCGDPDDTDQRGEVRPQGPNCDIGAFEVTILPIDTDGDGVFDIYDLCPATSAGAPVDFNGCSDLQVDQDVDGVCDPGAPSTGPSACLGSDNCPTVPNADQTDINGDGYGDACVSPDVVIPAGSTFGENPIIGAGTVINIGVTFGDNAVIGENVVINKDVATGDNVQIGESTVINRDVTLGDEVLIGPNILIDKNVTIGSRVEIGLNCPPPAEGDQPCVKIGKDSDIEDDVQIGVNVTLEQNVTVLAGTVIPDRTTIGKDQTVPQELVITDLYVQSGRAYQIVYDGLYPGETYYIDIPYVINSITTPDLEGSTFIKTAYFDNYNASETFMRFTLNKSAAVYVGYDTRDGIPVWLSDFTFTGEYIFTTDPKCNLRLFRKDFSAGEVVLGGNKVGITKDKNMYIVIVN